jgi:hypothetical protein
MATQAIQFSPPRPNPTREHLVALLENALVTLEEREQRAVERARIAGAFGAYVGQARALERADAYAEVRRLIVAVLHG